MATTLDIVITDAGLQEVINAEHSGTAPVLLTQVGFGSGIYTPTASQTELEHEIKRVETISGGYAGDNILHIQALDGEAGDAYVVYEVGVYTSTGTLFAVYSQALPILHKIADAQIMLAIDIALTGIQPSSVAIGDTNYSLAPATHSIQGVVELATDEEVLAGTDDSKAVTPAGIASAYATSKVAKAQRRANDSTLIASSWNNPGGLYNSALITGLYSTLNGVVLASDTDITMYREDNPGTYFTVNIPGVINCLTVEGQFIVATYTGFYITDAPFTSTSTFKLYQPLGPNVFYFGVAYGGGHFVAFSVDSVVDFIPDETEDTYKYLQTHGLPEGAGDEAYRAICYSPVYNKFCLVTEEVIPPPNSSTNLYSCFMEPGGEPSYPFIRAIAQNLTFVGDIHIGWSDLDEIFIVTMSAVSGFGGGGSMFWYSFTGDTTWFETNLNASQDLILTTDLGASVWSDTSVKAIELVAKTPPTFNVRNITINSVLQVGSGTNYNSGRCLCLHKGSWWCTITNSTTNTSTLLISDGRNTME